MYPLLFELGPLNIYSYGVILGGSYFLALWYALQRARLAGLNEQRIVDVGLVGFFSAVVGAKLMLLVVDFDRYAREPAAVMGLMWVGGVFYGGQDLMDVKRRWARCSS